MSWFERFATEGLVFPAVMVAFGSLVILRAASTPVATAVQCDGVPRWVRWLAERNSEALQRRCGWGIIAAAVVIALVRLATR